MKTTIQISDALLAETQTIAAKEKTTLKALVDEGLRRVVSDRKTRKPFKLKDGSFKGGRGLQTEFENASWDEIRDASYGLPRR